MSKPSQPPRPGRPHPARRPTPASRNTPLLEVSALRVSRGSATLIDGIDWRVGPGEHWVILGPNGCGKTTLLKALTGYLAASDGGISLLGHDYGSTDWRALRLKIGMVSSAFQASIPPAEPAWETVVSGRYAQLDLWINSTASDRRAARALLHQVGAESLADRPWLYLSQGERQRVLIARALMARPSLLILDEPCAGLDPVAREAFLTQVDGLASRASGPAIVLVTHHVEEITSAFTHALLLRRGKVVAAGPIGWVLNNRRLRETFESRVNLRRRAGRYTLTVEDGHRRNKAL